MKKVFIAAGIAASLILSGCATTTGGTGSAENSVRSGFLPDYSKLLPVEGREGLERYIDRSANLASYKKIYIDPVEVFVSSEGAYSGIQPGVLNRISEAFRQAFVTEVSPVYQMAGNAGPDVLRVRLAITGIQPVSPSLGVTDFIPIKAIYNAGRAAAGASPRLAEMTAEIEVLDGKGQQVAAAVVTRKSDKTLAQGDQITWNDLMPIMNAWAKQFRAGLDEARQQGGAR